MIADVIRLRHADFATQETLRVGTPGDQKSNFADTLHEVLSADLGELLPVRILEFENELRGHDCEQVELRYQDFEKEFDSHRRLLVERLGPPDEEGNSDHPNVYLGGVRRYAFWPIANGRLYLAFSHEDNECPILLMLGTSDENG